VRKFEAFQVHKDSRLAFVCCQRLRPCEKCSAHGTALGIPFIRFVGIRVMVLSGRRMNGSSS